MSEKKNPTMPGRAKSPIPRGRKKKKSNERAEITTDERALIDEWLSKNEVTKEIPEEEIPED